MKTYDDIKKYVEYFGFILLSNNHNSKNNKLRIQCNANHIFERTFQKFLYNQTCYFCNKEEDRKRKENRVKKYLRDCGFELKSKFQKMGEDIKVRCKNDHEFWVKFDNFKSRKNKCFYCPNKNFYNLQSVQKELEKYQYNLLSDTYTNNTSNLKIECPNGHIYFTKFTNFKQGNRCPECSGKIPYSNKEVGELCQRKGYVLHSYNKYKNNKLKVECEQGHILYLSPTQIKNNETCAYCSGRYGYTKNKVENILKSDGYILLSAFQDNNQLITAICPQGHYWDFQFKHFIEGHRCKYCHYKNIRGKGHPNWKDGCAKSYQWFRRYIYQWREDSLLKYNGKCILTGSTDIEVHHYKNFKELVYECLENLKIEIYKDISMYTNNELEQIRAELVRLHYFYGLGVCLRKDLHRLFHDIYGRVNNSMEQFYDFTEKFNNNQLFIE